MLHFLCACWHLFFGAAIDEGRGARAKAAGGADGVHCGVAAANHDDVAIAAVVDRLVGIGEFVGAHQVDAGEEFVRRVDAVEVLAGDAERKCGSPAPVATKTAS